LKQNWVKFQIPSPKTAINLVKLPVEIKAIFFEAYISSLCEDGILLSDYPELSKYIDKLSDYLLLVEGNIYNTSYLEANEAYNSRSEINKQIAIERERKRNKTSTKRERDVNEITPEENRIEENKIEKNKIEKRREEKEPLLEKASKTRFQIPAESDVILYLQEELSSKYQKFKNLPACESFFEKWFSYYESNGWKVGRNQMKNWKASIRQWLSKDYSASKEEKLDESSFENWTDERKRIYKILQEA
jgi:hypothetical protein